MKKIFLAAAALLLAGGAAQAGEIKPAVLFDMGGKFDKSFNEGVFNGVEKFRKETGIKYREFEITKLRLGLEARTDEQGVARYAVAAGFRRPADLPVLAGQSGRIVY